MIKTKRLRIVPLTLEQLHDYVRLDGLLEDSLSLAHDSRTISDEFRDALTRIILPKLEAEPTMPLYTTIWIMIEEKQNVIVGDISFKGQPNENGEIEIGYGSQPQHSGNGYMKEAVKAMVDWAREQKQASSVLAETHKNNIPSIVILKKNGFEFTHEKGDMLWWKIKL